MSPNECRLYERSSRFHGAFKKEHAIEAGMTRGQVARRVQSGLWVPIHAGIYRCSASPITPDLLEAAAVLAAGPHGCLSHLSAAYRHGLRNTRPPVIEVFAAHWEGPVPEQVRVHRCRAPQKLDVVAVDGILCTSVPRTILDIAHLHPRELPSTADHAVRDGEATREELWLFARRSRGHHGQKRLRRRLEMQPLNLEAHDSDGETAFEEIASRCWPRRWVHHHLVPTREATFEIDFAFPEEKLAVEIDGRHHLLGDQVEFDARRDALLAEAGWETLRVTRKLVLSNPDETARLVDEALRRRRNPPPGQIQTPQT